MRGLQFNDVARSVIERVSRLVIAFLRSPGDLRVNWRSSRGKPVRELVCRMNLQCQSNFNSKSASQETLRAARELNASLANRTSLELRAKRKPLRPAQIIRHWRRFSAATLALAHLELERVCEPNVPLRFPIASCIAILALALP